MRVASWNMNKRKLGTWDYLINHLQPDICLLQELSPANEYINEKNLYKILNKKNIFSGMYFKHSNYKNLKMPADKIGMVNQCAIFEDSKIGKVFFINVYGRLGTPQGLPMPLLGMISIYVTILRDVYSAENILISGDFNMDRRMDDNPTGSRFSKKGERIHNAFFDGILNLGFKDCLRKYYPDFIETYRHNILKKRYPWELDHMFCTNNLYERLDKIEVINNSHVIELSDHNPIIADFN